MYEVSYYDNYGRGTIICYSYEEMQDVVNNLNLDDYVSGVSVSQIENDNQW